MRTLRTRLAESLRAVIDTHLGLIKGLEEDSEPDSLVSGLVEGKITYLTSSLPNRTRATAPRSESEPGAKTDSGSGS